MDCFCNYPFSCTLAILGFLYYKGSKLQKEQQEQKEQLFSATPVTMLVIDKRDSL